tara:strand:+ start:696 stop:1052 length:357 start_codon:yes stop_codon:yes gene_type:complete
MSDQFNSFISPVKKEIVDRIEKLDLSTLQKLHLKLLSHCLEVFKDISVKDNKEFPDEILLKKWCENESKKLKDESFSVLLFEQMNSAAIKLKNYAKSTGKYPLDLNLDDLIALTSFEN